MDRAALQTTFQCALEHQRAGRHKDAESLYRSLLAELPNHPDLHINLGNVLEAQDRSEEAIAEFETAIRIKPDYAEAFHNLGGALKKLDRLDEALAAYRRALAIKPDSPETLNNLGTTLIARGLMPEALETLRHAAQLNPNSPQALSNLGGLLVELGHGDEALVVLEHAISVDPSFAGVFLNLGKALAKANRLDDAVAAFREAIRLQPDFDEAYECLGLALHNLGELDEAIAAYTEAMRLAPDRPSAHSNLILSLHYHPGFDAAAILAEQKKWDARRSASTTNAFENDPTPERRLRIGYVSGDLWSHAVGRNLLPMFQAHDHQAVEVYFYCNNRERDSVTAAIQACADHFRNVVGMDEAEVCKIVRLDKIDVLIDLSQHTGKNRLAVFARKPSPVQIAFGGYPGGTGLAAMDYRISDPYLDPPDTDWLYVEKPLRLPHSFWLYNPVDHEPVSELPAARNGYVTFGCLNNACKMNESTWRLWLRVLSRIPNSRLNVLGSEPSQRRRVENFCADAGVSFQRLELIPRLPRSQYMREYQRIDIGLDTHPYNGHVSSLDSFWMGVPVVTRIGERAAGRGGWSLLTNLGLGELAGRSEEEFVQIATNLAGDLPRLTEMRRTLRERMLESPLTDATRFTANMESLYRQAWRQWCVASGRER